MYDVAVATASHVNSIDDVLTASATKLAGTAGTVIAASSVVAHASFDATDSPAALTALTVKQYSVAAVRPSTVYSKPSMPSATFSVPL